MHTRRSTASQFAASRGVALEPLADPSLFTPVLAIGSNAGPEQLRRKFPRDAFPGCVLPVGQIGSLAYTAPTKHLGR